MKYIRHIIVIQILNISKNTNVIIHTQFSTIYVIFNKFKLSGFRTCEIAQSKKSLIFKILYFIYTICTYGTNNIELFVNNH